MKRDTLIMGILNVTPDSFSDGGRYHQVDSALNRACEMVNEGAEIIDIGGESTRPGALPVAVAEELDRTAQVVDAVAKRFSARVSIDTRHYEVARAAVDQGATLINDVSAGSDVRIAELVASNPNLEIILMHMKGTPTNMQAEPVYPDGVVREVQAFLEDRVRAFEEVGVPKNRIWVDPGIGFGKTLQHNLELLRNLSAFGNMGARLVIGTSRKSFLAQILGSKDLPFSLRAEGTLMTNLWALQGGASVFRVHDPGSLTRAFRTWGALGGGLEK